MAASTWSLPVPDRDRLIKAAFEGEVVVAARMQQILTDVPEFSLIIVGVAAKEFAYCRYSNFRVGAAFLSADGQIIKGANVENASSGKRWTLDGGLLLVVPH